MPINVTAGQVIAITIGAPGTSRSRYVFTGSNAEATTFGSLLSIDGGKSGWWQDTGHVYGGGGGRVSATLINYPSPYGQGGGAWAPADAGPVEAGACSTIPGSPVMFPGPTGAGGGSNTATGPDGGASAGGIAGGAGGVSIAPRASGGGGGSTPFGAGGYGGVGTVGAETNGQDGQGYGSGGGGAGVPFKIGGIGNTGYVLITWVGSGGATPPSTTLITETGTAMVAEAGGLDYLVPE